MTPFAQLGPSLYARGYSPIPIMPASKVPGLHVDGSWRLFKGWNIYCLEQPSQWHVNQWASWPNAGIGVACGRGLICIDIDQEFLLDPIMAILPPSPVQKKGRKGISLFYRGDTEKIRSRNFRTVERVGLLDLLAEGKQTILPPSIHEDTNEPYFWWSDATLADFRVEELPELPDDIADRIAEALKPFGYDPNRERAEFAVAQARSASHAVGGRGIYRQTNDDALADLECWVPKLELYKQRRKLGGFEAVAHWRSSSTGRALEMRKRSLSIVRKGIEDFGEGRKYTPIDLVMEARHCDASTAVDWLLEQLPQDGPEILLLNGPKTMEILAERDRLKSSTSGESMPGNTIVATTPAASRKHEKFRVTMFDDINDSEKKEWVVEGFIAAGEFSYAVGKPGSSKSVIFTDAACHVGAGMEWHGRAVKKGLVVYLAAERGKVTRRRMMAFRKHYVASGVAVAVIEGATDLTNGLADAVTLAERITELGKDCGLPPVWIIVDTLSRTFGGGDQNKSQDMGKFVRSVDTIIEKTGAHVTVIHHTPWEQERAKGAIDLDGAVDASFIVRKNNDRCTLRCDGGNDQEEGLIVAYTMKSVVVGTDESGKVTDAPVVIRDEAATDSDDDGIKLSSKKPVLAVRLFQTAIREKGKENPTDGRTAVHESDLKEIILREKGKGSNATRKSREAMVRKVIADIRVKVADEIGEWFYPKAANDNIKFQRAGEANSEQRTPP